MVLVSQKPIDEKVLNFSMSKYLLRTIFCIPFLYIGCSEDEAEELPYIPVEWISYEHTASCYNDLNSSFVDDFIEVMGINGASGYPTHPLECEIFVACKYVHYYENLGYIEYERNSDTSMKSRDLTDKNNIQYQAK